MKVKVAYVSQGACTDQSMQEPINILSLIFAIPPRSTDGSDSFECLCEVSCVEGAIGCRVGVIANSRQLAWRWGKVDGGWLGWRFLIEVELGKRGCGLE